MNAHTALQIITWVSLGVGFVAAITSQFWKTSVEIEGSIRKRLTTAGWILVVVAAVSFIAGIAAALIREHIAPGEALIQRQIFASTQPLASLSLHFAFSSNDPQLWQKMRAGEQKIDDNANSTQGGVPEVSYEVMDYDAALVPLLSFIAHIGAAIDPTENHYWGKPPRNPSIVVLIPLDDSQNTILSFGEISGDVWLRSDEPSALSAGFPTSQAQSRPRRGHDAPHASKQLSSTAEGASSYAIDWHLDPATLAASIDRANTASASTAKLPPLLKLALLFDIKTLPFHEANFAVTEVDLWDSGDFGKKPVDFSGKLKNFELTLTANESRDLIWKYRFKHAYLQDLFYDGTDEAELRCLVLEFESQ